MESQKKQMRNLQFCIAKLENFLKIMPGTPGQDINWEEFKQQRDLAQMSLSHLASILGGDNTGDETYIENECLVYPKI